MAILLEITNKALRESYQCKYLLQVWDTSSERKLHEMRLQGNVPYSNVLGAMQTWGMVREYFFY